MKKLLLFTVIGVLSFTQSFAQDFNFGAKAGINFANIGGDESDEFEAKTGYHLGLVAEFMLTDHFGFQPELLYSTQGAKASESYSEDGYVENYEVKIKLDYINVPLLAKYFITEGLSLEAGPQVGFLLSGKQDYTYTASFDGETETESGSEDIKEYLNTVDLGLLGGIGYKLDMGLVFNARYALGLSNINSEEEAGEDLKQSNNVFQFSVGYMF